MSIGAGLFLPSKNYFLLGKILNILVSHFSQVPVIAFLSTLPFPLKDVSCSPFIILLALHLTQYPSVAIIFVYPPPAEVNNKLIHSLAHLDLNVNPEQIKWG